MRRSLITTRTYSTGEDNSFKTFAKNGDEGKQEESPTTGATAFFAFCLALESVGELDPPLSLGLFEAEEGNAHREDDSRCNQTERSFPELF